MIDLTCYVGRLREDIELPSLRLDGRFIPDYFRKGSMDDDGNASIRLRMNTAARINQGVLEDDEPTNAYYLQRSLYKLTRNARVDKIDNIALILADEYKGRPNLFGIMFDRGFDDGNVPREGCAIFLNAISRLRQHDEDYEDEIVFTAIHELGHVFNLWHIEGYDNFMSKSPSDRVAQPSAYRFKPDHRKFLHMAPTSKYVWPGGSDFEERGGLGPSGGSPFNKVDTEIRLKIEIEQKEFWYFEPIELDITISTSSKKGRRIPDEIDPGYDRFSLYITRPDGTIFKYRSPRRYCHNHSSIKLDNKSPFHRDISIFGQSGGHTFSMPGVYKIQCFFRYGKRKTVASNEEKVFVRERPRKLSNEFRSVEAMFTDSEVARLLYHRSGKYTKPCLQMLNEFCKTRKKDLLGQNVKYALARFYSQASGSHHRKKILNQALAYAHDSLDSGLLSKGREKNLQLMTSSLTG